MTKKETKKEEKESTEVIVIDPGNVGPVALQERMKIEMEKRVVLTDYISKNLKDGEDYGRLKIGGVDSKKILFKPGSEKFCSLFGLRPRFRQDAETLAMLGNKPGIVAYICELYTKDDKVVGEGRGVASVEEKRWSLNNMVKIAEKRAQIDAVLRTGALSDFFTQDLEDDNGKEAKEKELDLITEKQRAMIFKLLEETGKTKEGFEQWILKTFNVIGLENLTIQQASRVIDAMLMMPKKDREDMSTIRVDEGRDDEGFKKSQYPEEEAIDAEKIPW